MTTTPSPSRQAVRRRASRAAGPANGSAAETTSVRLDAPQPAGTRPARKTSAPPRRRAHRRLVAASALAFGGIATAAIASVVVVMVIQQRHAHASEARNQRFVDTASQLAVNMYSYNQNNLDDSVNRMVNGTSGPLHDKFSQGNNLDLLKSFFRSTGGSAEAVVNGAALESVDDVSNNASVLVSVRVTMSDMNGNNQPSKPSRMRIIVHEDDNGNMTGYDLKWPNGGN
jgi:Mce-associated membrane protein